MCKDCNHINWEITYREYGYDGLYFDSLVIKACSDINCALEKAKVEVKNNTITAIERIF